MTNTVQAKSKNKRVDSHFSSIGQSEGDTYGSPEPTMQHDNRAFLETEAGNMRESINAKESLDPGSSRKFGASV